MPTILEMTFKRRKPERFLVLWDNGEELLFSPEIAATYRFAIGKFFDESAYEKMLLEDGIRRAKDQMMRYLGIRPHSQQELRLKSLKKGYTPEQIDQALSDLADVNLIDDAQFARQFINNELLLRPCGKRLLQNKLMQKGVSTDIFNPILDEIYENVSREEIIRKIAEKFLRRQQKQPRKKQIEKLTRHLQGKGFGWDMISWVLYETNLTNSEDDY